ncbi:MAG: galactitol-1-phosphate 5-dehydrogenase [Firmicutes bacterium]|nr:galactitol-1-phosphate 5-dehydrogenase [Bacillota bacterium]
MKVLNLHGIGDLRYEELPDPTPKAGEVLVKIKACGICGSDVPRVLTKGTYHFPTVVGHEFAGQVVELGAGADPALLGRKAAVFPLLPCFKCDMCVREQYASCVNYNYFGSRCDGGFSEYIAAPVWNLVLAGESADFEELAMAEPCAVALHALRRCDIKSGETVAVFGAGPIGVMAAQWAQALGCRAILADVDAQKAGFARSVGFSDVYAGTEGADYVKEATKGAGAGICVDAAGVAPAMESCFYAAAPLGRVAALGNPAGGMNFSQKAYWEILRKQLRVCGSWNSGYESGSNDWTDAIKYMACGDLKLKPLITHRYGLSDGLAPFHMIADKKEFFNKVMYVM